MCYKLKEQSNYLTMEIDSDQMRQHAGDACMENQMKTDWNLQTGGRTDADRILGRSA